MNQEALRDTSILLVEAETLLAIMYAKCFVDLQIPTVFTETQIPENLLELMESKGIDAAILHISAEKEKNAILVAHRAGKKIIVIRRSPPTTWLEVRMYKEFEAAGIPMVDKSADAFDRALEKLSTPTSFSA